MRVARIALALGVGLALILPGAPAWSQKARAERPTYSVGARWILKDGVYDLIRIDRGRYIFAAGSGRQIHLTKDLGVAAVLRAGLWVWSLEPPPEIRWPLEVGRCGVLHRATFHNRDHPGGLHVRVTWEVKSYEDVAVAGGVSKAFRILYRVDVDDGGLSRRSMVVAGPQSWHLTVWYAPDAQQIVKAEAINAEALSWEVVALDRPSPATMRVVLDEPKDQARVIGERITVGGRVSAGSAAVRVSATLNGAEVFSRTLADAPTQGVGLSFPVTPRDGKNVLVVTVEDGHGNRKQEARVFFRDRPASPVPAPAHPTPSPTPLRVIVASPADGPASTRTPSPWPRWLRAARESAGSW